MKERSVTIGLTEAAQMAADRRNFRRRLTERIHDAQVMGYEAYEPIPGWTTTLETVFLLPVLDEYDRFYRKHEIQSHVVAVHSPWTHDRLTHPGPAANDTAKAYLGRYPLTLSTSVPFLGIVAAERICQIADAQLVTHWPQIEGGIKNATPWQNAARKHIQKINDGITQKQTAEMHALIGMSDDEIAQWLGENEQRKLAIVSGNDVRNRVYGRKSSVDWRKKAQFVNGFYVKEGWDEDTLKGDLETVLSVTKEPIWLMVNYAGGANSKTAEEIGRVVNSVLEAGGD
ncbi:hypothetical protein IPM62_01650 [Candidatus Woesebacteria bacterium]|nr:MAG: hypothetical protein IPM62_01650 [Candidatus Woesebacteria bacterium]